MFYHHAAHLRLGHQVMDCEKPHGFSATLPRAEQTPVWPPPVRSPLPAALSSNPSRTPARAHRTRAACTECSAPAACIRGCRHWRNYALPPASWRPPLTRGTSTPAASSPTVWRSMRPVRGERQGDDAHAVFDVTSPARSVWSL